MLSLLKKIESNWKGYANMRVPVKVFGCCPGKKTSTCLIILQVSSERSEREKNNSNILCLFSEKKVGLIVKFYGCEPFYTQVISYPGHFLPTLVISYQRFSHFVPSINHFVPRSFRIYVLVISYPVSTISYPGHFVPILVISYLGQLGTK